MSKRRGQGFVYHPTFKNAAGKTVETRTWWIGYSIDGKKIRDSRLRRFVGRTGPITYTCVPPGSGRRMGVDRDDDGVLDRRDNCPDVYTPDQSDTDDDGRGDLCE